MRNNEKFCGVENFGVLIPYRDLERLIHFANNFDQLEERLQQMDKQLQGIRGLQSDLLEKVGDLERSL